MSNLHINGIEQKPVFQVYTLNNSLVKTIQMPLVMEAIEYMPEREIDVTEYLCGNTGIEFLGYKHNWRLDYEKFMYSQDVMNCLIELMTFADSNLHYLKIKILSDSDDSQFIKCIIVNTGFVMKLIYEGLYSKGYEGLSLEVRSVERHSTFWSGWKLINPFFTSPLNYETGEPIIAN